MATELWLILLATASISMVLCFVLTPLAKRVGLLDHPSDRKVHRSATPLVGGIAAFIALTMAVILSTPYSVESLPLLAACGLMLITGIFDDLHELSPKTRFIIQIIACCIMIFGSGVVLTDFGSLMWNGVLPLGWFSIPMLCSMA